MFDFIKYDLKVAAVLAVFYLFYRLLLSRDTFHRLNRIVLLATSALSFVLPLCVITIRRTEWLEALPALPELSVTRYGSASGVPAWQEAAAVLFLLGAAAVLVRLAVSIFSIQKIIREGERLPDGQGNVLVVTGRNVAPFSWRRHIVLSRADWAREREKPQSEILLHERAHIQCRHSRDILLVEALSALQWFNPAIWLLKRDLRAIHEYEADAAVLSQGIDARQYQYLLVRKAMASAGYTVANSFSHSTLKNRIAMMIKPQSPLAASWKLLYLVPLVGLSLVATARTVTDYEVRGQVSESPSVAVTSQDHSEKQKADSVPFELVEVKPTFNGKDAGAFAKWVNEHLKYPEAAFKNGIQGKVIIQFTVEKDGTVGQVKVLRDADPALDQEAVRVLSTVPEWTPGQSGGKPVPVTFTFPVVFSIN